MKWRYYPLASFPKQGIMVSSYGERKFAEFLTPAEAKAEAERKRRAA